jgi:dolichol-phosphate mannosyltransferase
MDLSLVVPTYNERENISILAHKIQEEFKLNKIHGEIIFVDDNSPDGTGGILEDLRKKTKNIKVVHRSGKLGLSSAVLDGWKISSGKILGVMDADLSHPVEKIHELFFPIKKDEADFTIGSRYIKGGKILGWDFKRKLMSKTATLFARPFTNVKDPMTGFFMIKKDCADFDKLNSKGFKILLELILKADYKKIKEIPITFINRVKGKSKAGSSEIFYYLKNLFGYKNYIRKEIKEFFKFGIVGTIGAVINLGTLYALTEFLGIYYIISAIFAFIIAVTSNYFLNKTWTFKEKVADRTLRKYVQFFSVSVFALGVNLIILYSLTEFVGIWYMLSELIAKVIVFFVNFFGNKLWTFRK